MLTFPISSFFIIIINGTIYTNYSFFFNIICTTLFALERYTYVAKPVQLSCLTWYHAVLWSEWQPERTRPSLELDPFNLIIMIESVLTIPIYSFLFAKYAFCYSCFVDKKSSQDLYHRFLLNFIFLNCSFFFWCPGKWQAWSDTAYYYMYL